MGDTLQDLYREAGLSNIGRPIDRSRPILENPDGTFSTEETITIEADGRWYNIPTIVNGRRVSEDEAVAMWRGGQNRDVGGFASLPEAETAARARTQQIGNVRSRDRNAMPAGLSPAWRNTPEANSPPRRPMPRQLRTRAPTYADVQRELPRGEAYAPPTNQIAGAGQQALEMTGLPSVRRSARAFTNGDPRTGAEEGALGLLGVAGLAGLVPRGRAPVRPPMRNPYLDQLRREGFDVETPLYHGSATPVSEFKGTLYVSKSPEVGSRFAQAGNRIRGSEPSGENVMPLYGRPGRQITLDPRDMSLPEYDAFLEKARADGYDSVRIGGLHDETIYFNPERDIRPRFGSAPPRPMAAAEAPAIAPRPEPRLPGRASDGSVLPVRPREPFRNSLRGGSEDLMGAASRGPVSVRPYLRALGDDPGDIELGQTIERAVEVARRAGNSTVRDVPLSEVTAVQDLVHPGFRKTAEPSWSGEPAIPEVLQHKGRFYIMDGHHRAAALAARGDPVIRARVYDSHPPNQPKSSRRPKPPSGGFLLPRRP